MILILIKQRIVNLEVSDLSHLKLTSVKSVKWSRTSKIYYFIVLGGGGILQESLRIFTNNYKQYVPGFVNLCDDKKLKGILNVHLKCNETCVVVATEEICKFIKNVCNEIDEYLIQSYEIIWITLMYWLISGKLIHFIMYMVLTWCTIR